MTVRFFSVAFTFVLFASFCAVLDAGPAQSAPRFQDYPAQSYSGRVQSPDLTSHPDARTYRTRLRNAAKGGVNFSGDHILATWGCGGQCLMGAVINARSGYVQFLPGTICCWLEAGEDINPIDFERGSDLLILTGMVDEEEPLARFYYDFSGRDFRLIKKEVLSSANSGGDPQTVAPSCPSGFTFSRGQCVRNTASVPEETDFEILDGYDLFGGDYSSMPGKVHYDDCEFECKNDTRCRSFTYNTKARKCFLKSSVPNRSRFQDAISGIKQ